MAAAGVSPVPHGPSVATAAYEWANGDTVHVQLLLLKTMLT